MVPLVSLWLPIVLAAVVVFFASALLHMVLKYHNSDYRKLPNEDVAGDVLRGTPRGHYVLPHSGGGASFKDPAFIERLKRGPVAFITVMQPGPPNMGKPLAQWFAFSLFVSVLAAYVAGRALAPGAEYSEVFRFVGTTAFIAYGLGTVQESIWFGRLWSVTMKHALDGLVYALLSAGIFGWLWPK
jgi:hypothetical protein